MPSWHSLSPALPERRPGPERPLPLPLQAALRPDRAMTGPRPPAEAAPAGGLDPDLLLRFLPLLRELNSSQDSNARQLLYALRPYLKPERQVKVERALQLARLFRIGRRFLTGREGHV